MKKLSLLLIPLLLTLTACSNAKPDSIISSDTSKTSSSSESSGSSVESESSIEEVPTELLESIVNKLHNGSYELNRTIESRNTPDPDVPSRLDKDKIRKDDDKYEVLKFDKSNNSYSTDYYMNKEQIGEKETYFLYTYNPDFPTLYSYYPDYPLPVS